MTSLRRCVLLLIISIAATCAAQKAAPAALSKLQIAGTVVDRLTGQPLAEATVILAPVNQRRDEVTFRTGSDGRFLFSNLPPGKYSLGAKRHGYTLQGFEQHELFATAIAVGPDIDSEHLLFRLHPDASIRGTITDENNDPAVGIRVQLFGIRMEDGEKSVRRTSQTSTDDHGQYSFSHLQEGTYYLAASGKPWYSNYSGFVQQSRMQTKDPETRARLEEEAAKLDLVYPLTFYSGALSSDDATPIQLAAGEAVTADMALQPVRSVHIRIPGGSSPEVLDGREQGIIVSSGPGRVGFSSGSTHPRITLSRQIFGGQVEDNSMMTSVFGSPDGSYEIAGIAPGRYTVEVDAAGNSKVPSTSQLLDLGGDLDLSTSNGTPLARISGTAWFNGAPLDLAFIEMRAVDARRGFAAQVKKGIFQFDEPVPPGRYQVTIGSPSNSNLYLSTVSASGASLTGRSVQITSGASVQLAIVAAEGLAEINGVAKSNGKSVAGIMVLLVPEDLTNRTALARRDQSDSDGTFTLRNVVPGRYYLLAIENGWNLAWADSKVLKPFLTNARPLMIQSNQKLQMAVEVRSAK